MIRNITFANEQTTGSAEFIPQPASSPEPENLTLRLRPVTVSPSEEYQLRPGQVRPISNELAAAILSFKGRAEINNRGVVVDRKDLGGRFTYFHEHSVTLNDFATRERRLYYVINRQVPEVLHLLDETGAYIESLPLRERPPVLDNDAQAEQLRQHKSVASRAATRLQQLHAEDTREAIETIAANSREMQRVVMTLPAPCTAPAESLQPHRSPQGEVIAEVTRHTAERVVRAKAAGSTTDIVTRRSRAATCPF
jgi:hypothetical protein